MTGAPLISSHGQGIRRYDAPVRQCSALRWPGGAAEMIDRSIEVDTEVCLRATRHVFYASFDQNLSYGESRYDGLHINTGPQPLRNLTIWPAEGEMIGRIRGGGHTRYLAIFFDPIFLLRAAGAEALAGCQLVPHWGWDDGIAWSLALAIRQECEAGAPHGTLYAEVMATALSAHLLRRYSNLDTIRLKPARGGLAAWQLKRVCEYLEAHLGEDTTLAELAAIADLSPAHFCRAFKASTGKTITRWRTERRIARGKDMLADPRLPITDIALACGFSDHSHFGKVFREHTGIAPSAWRRERLT